MKRSTKRSIKLTRVKLEQYYVQSTIAQNESFSKTTVTFLQDNYLDLLHVLSCASCLQV